MITFTLEEVNARIAEIQRIISRTEDAYLYNLAMNDLRYYSRLAVKIQVGA